MTDEEITELVMALSRSWRGRPTNDVASFERDMIEMCKKVRRKVMNKYDPDIGLDSYYKENTCD